MQQSELEMNFLSGKLFDIRDIPKNKRYLYKYFKTDEQRLFVRYFLLHRSHDQFVPHTGIRFKRRWRQYLARRINYLEDAWQRANEAGDIERLALIELGRIKVPKK